MNNTIVELFSQQEQGKQFLDSLPVAVYATDPDGKLTYFNSAAARLSGREPEIGTDRWCVSWKIYSTDGTPISHEEGPMAVSLDEERPLEGEEAIIERPDGKKIWIKAYPSPLRNEEGTVTGGINVLVDITDQKETEIQLRRNEQELTDFFNNASVGIRWVRPDGTIKRANNTELNMFGYSPEEYIGRHIADFHADEDEIEEAIQKLSAGEDLKDFETQVKCKDGSIRHVVLNANAYREDGEFVHTRCITRDITPRKLAEQTLNQSEEKYRTLLNKMDEGLCIIKVEFDEGDEPVDFRYLETNPAYETHTGMTGMKGKKASEVLSDSAPAVIRRHGKVALTGEPFHEEVYIEDIERWIDTSAFRIGAPEERKVAVLFHDITERKKAQQELKTVNKNLEKRVKKRTEALLSYQSQLRSLASQLSITEEKQRQHLATELHDNLGQLLAIGKMKIKALQKNQVPDHSPKVVTDLEEVISDALDYTRGLMTDLKPPPSFNDDIRASVEWVANKLKKRELTVSIKDDGRPKPLSKEVETTTLQCIRELLNNVIKHTSEKEAVITFNGSEDQLQVSVEDEGPGFNVEHKDLSPGQDGKFGLFNIQERIDLLGGMVDINAEPGQGTKVTIGVPLAENMQATESRKETARANQTDGEQAGEATPEEKIKVLLVDDHQMVREGLRKIIEDEDDIIVVGEAATGEEAIELTRQTPPDIILMDINLPGIDGIEATRTISGEKPDMRIIGLSLHNDKGVVEDMRSAGASAYLTKGDAFESLIVTIRAEAQKENTT